MNPSALPSYTKLLQSSVRLYSVHALKLIFICLIFVLPMLVFIYLMLTVNPLGAFEASRFAVFVLIILYGFLAIAVSLFSLLCTAALIIYTSRAFDQTPVTVLDAYREAMKVFFNFLKLISVYSWKVMLWSMLLIIPGMYQGILYSFAPLFMIAEGASIQEAMAKSREFMKRYWVRYLDYLLFTLIITVICMIPFFVVLDFVIDWCVARNYWRLVALPDFLEMVVVLAACQFIFVFCMVFYKEVKSNI